MKPILFPLRNHNDSYNLSIVSESSTIDKPVDLGETTKWWGACFEEIGPNADHNNIIVY